MLGHQIRKRYYITLGTSVTNILMKHSSLVSFSLAILSIINFKITQGSQGIRQWTIYIPNRDTSLDTASLEPTNWNSIKVPNVFEHTYKLTWLENFRYIYHLQSYVSSLPKLYQIILKNFPSCKIKTNLNNLTWNYRRSRGL